MTTAKPILTNTPLEASALAVGRRLAAAKTYKTESAVRSGKEFWYQVAKNGNEIVMASYGSTQAEAEARMRLAAAAPALLELLKDALDVYDRGYGQLQWIDRARAAIAAASGKEEGR